MTMRSRAMWIRRQGHAGMEQGWGRYLGDNGIFIGMSTFGASAPGPTCFEKFGITTEKIVEAAKKSMKK